MKRMAAVKGTTSNSKKSEGKKKVEAKTEEIRPTVSSIERAFAVFDRDSDGSVTREEVEAVLREADVSFTDKQITKFMQKLDNDGDGTVDFREFCGALKDEMTDAIDKDERMRGAFSCIDTDDDGRLSASELVAAVTHLGKSITQKEACDVIKLVDKSGDGHLIYDEFVSLMYLLKIG